MLLLLGALSGVLVLRAGPTGFSVLLATALLLLLLLLLECLVLLRLFLG